MAAQQPVADHQTQHTPLGQAPHASRLRFVASDAVGLPVKRKQVQHACLACRQKKKKCNHGSETVGLLQPSDGHGGAKRLRPAVETGARLKPLAGADDGPSSASIDIDEDASTAASHLLGLSDRTGGHVSTEFQEEADPQARFVGDLNPENILISAMAEVSRTSTTAHHQRDSAVGIWKEPVRPDRNGRGDSSKVSGTACAIENLLSHRAIVPDDITALEQALHTARDTWLAGCLAGIDPPQHAFASLRSIYLRKIHPLFPIFDEKRLMALGTHRIDKAIKLAICLAAATDHEAKAHLRLEAYPTILSYQDFSAKVSHLLRGLVEEIDFSNRLLDQIRILALMAMYWQPLEEQDWDGPARLFSEAMSIVFSIGLHLEVYDRVYHIHDQQHEANPGHAPRQRCREDIERIFLCLFALDRMIASFYGRPILLNERDFDRDVLKCAAKQAPVFRLFILVVWQLSLIQDLYRPSSRVSPNLQTADGPVFERQILESGAENAPPSMLATIEVFHHAVSALSVRQTRQAFEPAPARGSEVDNNNNSSSNNDSSKQELYPHLPQPLLNARRSISADRILQIVKQYDVGPLPFIPYALSISLSVAYRKWRFSQIPMFRARGREAFMEVLPVLEKWGRVFTAARVNYNLAQKVVEGMEKVQDNIKRKCREGTPVRRERLHGQPQSTTHPSGTAHSSAVPGPFASSSSSSSSPSSRPDSTHPITTTAGGGPPPSSAPASTANPHHPPFPPPPGPRTASSSSLDPNPSAGAPLAFPDDLATLNLFNFFDDTATNLDVGLGEMDSMFDRNLDPMAPAFWPAYPSMDPERVEGGGGAYYT